MWVDVEHVEGRLEEKDLARFAAALVRVALDEDLAAAVTNC